MTPKTKIICGCGLLLPFATEKDIVTHFQYVKIIFNNLIELFEQVDTSPQKVKRNAGKC